jgi:DNA-binding transcriptional LysR family regulator
LPAALAVLRQKWPNIRFAVTVGLCESIREGLTSGQFDVGVTLQPDKCAAGNGPVPQQASSAEPLLLAHVPLVVFAATQHPLALEKANTEVPRERLAPYPIFVADSKGHFYTLVRDFFRADGAAGSPLESTGSVESVKRSVMTNPLGLGVLPKYALAEELRAGLVQALMVRPGVPSVRLEAMLYRTRSPMHPAVAELVDVLSTNVGRPTEKDGRGRTGAASEASTGSSAQDRSS